MEQQGEHCSCMLVSIFYFWHGLAVPLLCQLLKDMYARADIQQRTNARHLKAIGSVSASYKSMADKTWLPPPVKVVAQIVWRPRLILPASILSCSQTYGTAFRSGANLLVCAREGDNKQLWGDALQQ